MSRIADTVVEETSAGSGRHEWSSTFWGSRTRCGARCWRWLPGGDFMQDLAEAGIIELGRRRFTVVDSTALARAAR